MRPRCLVYFSASHPPLTVLAEEAGLAVVLEVEGFVVTGLVVVEEEAGLAVVLEVAGLAVEVEVLEELLAGTVAGLVLGVLLMV